MRNWFARLRRAWVCLSVCSAVGLSLAPSSSIADTVISTGPFCSDCVLTNITFYSVDQFDEFVEVAEIGFDACLDCFDDYASRVNLIRGRCNNISNACDTISGNLSFIVGSEYSSYVNAIGSSVADIRSSLGNTWGSGIVSQLDSIQHQMSSARDDVELCRDYFENDVVAYRAQVATSCDPSSSGGSGGSTGCCCPDYTQYIDEVEDYLSDLSTTISSIDSLLRSYLININTILSQIHYFMEYIDEYTYYSMNSLVNFLGSADSVFGLHSSLDDDNIGLAAGNYFGSSLYSQLVLDDALTNVVTRLAIRDWWNWQGHLHDSPDYQDFTDFASVGIQGLTGLVMPYDDADAWPIVNSWRDFYYNRNVHPTNEISNPLWVAFTNRVRLSDDIVNISVSSYSGDSIAQLTAMLTNIVLNVVQVTNDINVTAEAEVDVAVDILDEKVDETSDPEQESDTIRTNRVDLSSISRVMRSTVSSYKSIFTTILQEEPPERIMITSGWHVGYEGLDFEIESIYWEPDGVENHWLTVIRKIFRAVWACVFLVVIYAACGFDLFVVGVCAYMCYGVLTGRTDVAVKGLKSCFDVLCRMLGFHAGK